LIVISELSFAKLSFAVYVPGGIELPFRPPKIKTPSIGGSDALAKSQVNRWNSFLDANTSGAEGSPGQVLNLFGF
jgi:hypothetical protein